MSNKSGQSFLSFVLGMVTGGVLGLLFAPQKGTQSRNKLTFLLDSYKKQAKEILHDVIIGKAKIKSEAKAEGEKIIHEAKEKAEQLLDDVNGLMDQIQNK